jgi:phosphatidylserine/phosphatidylglycerophosphate/cardiolipin synthase-like enzyme
MSSAVALTFLRDTRHGGNANQPAQTAAALAAFVASATRSVDIAIYDFRLSDALAAPVVGALTAAAARGVAVRIGFDQGKPADATAMTFARIQADPAPPGTLEWITSHFAGTQVLTKPIDAKSQLMHDKYVIRDAGHRGAAVWTGSTNFTDDAWTLQENNIVRITSGPLAKAYRTDFDEMWQTGAISGSGKNLAGTATLAGVGLGWDYSPGDGAAIDADLVAHVNAAQQRVVIAAMVLTSHTLLDAIVAAISRGVPVSGVYDAGQMDPIVEEWKKSTSPASAKALSQWTQIACLLVGKKSMPYQPDSLHDFLHHKVIVSDATVSTGSYNFSANAEHNAENYLVMTSASLADRYTQQIAAVADEYRVG